MTMPNVQANQGPLTGAPNASGAPGGTDVTQRLEAALDSDKSFKKFIGGVMGQCENEYAAVRQKVHTGELTAAEAETEIDRLKALLPTKVVDQFLFVGVDFKGQAQYAFATTGRKLSAAVSLNPLGILGLNARLELEGSAQTSSFLGLLVVRGPQRAGNFAVSRPITLHSFIGSSSKFTLAGSFEASVGWEGTFTGSLTDEPEEEEDAAGEQNNDATDKNKSAPATPPESVRLKAPELDQGLLGGDVDEETCLEYLAVGIELKTGVKASLNYEYESYSAADPTPSFYDKSQGDSLRSDLLGLMVEGSAKALAKSRASEVINGNPEYFAPIELEKTTFWKTFRAGSEDLFDRLIHPKKDPPNDATGEDLRDLVWRTLNALWPFLPENHDNAVRRFESFARWYPYVASQPTLPRDYRGPSRCAEDLFPDVDGHPGQSRKPATHPVRFNELRAGDAAPELRVEFASIRDQIGWSLEPYVHVERRSMCLDVQAMLRTLGVNEKMFPPLPKPNGRLGEAYLKVLTPVLVAEARSSWEPAAEVYAKATLDLMRRGGALGRCVNEPLRSLLLVSSHAPQASAKAFVKAEAYLKVPLITDSSAVAEASVSIGGEFKQAMTTFQTFVWGQKPGENRRPLYTTYETRIRYTSFKLEGRVEAGAEAKVGGGHGDEWKLFDPKVVEKKPDRLNRMRYRCAVVTWQGGRASAFKAAPGPGTGVVYGESFVVGNLLKIYQREKDNALHRKWWDDYSKNRGARDDLKAQWAGWALPPYLRDQRPEIYAPHREPYFERVATALNVPHRVLVDFLLHREVRSALRDTELSLARSGSLLIEAAFRLDDWKALEVRGRQKKVLDRLVPVLSRRSLGNLFKARPRTLESIRLRFRKRDHEVDETSLFTLGFKVVGKETSINLSSVEAAGTDAVFDIVTMFIDDKGMRTATSADYETAVPPAILFSQ